MSSGNKRQTGFRNTSSDNRQVNKAKTGFKGGIGKQYASNSQYQRGGPGSNGIESEDDGQSDFKTTALRFTNNNFIDERRQRMERESSLGPGGNNSLL